MALLDFPKVRPRMGPVILLATINVSLNVQSPISTCICMVLVEVYMSPFATCSLKGGGSDSFRMLARLIFLRFLYSFSGMQLTRVPESIRASMEKCWKSIGANNMRLFCLSGIAEIIGSHCSPLGYLLW